MPDENEEFLEKEESLEFDFSSDDLNEEDKKFKDYIESKEFIAMSEFDKDKALKEKFGEIVTLDDYDFLQ